MRKAITRGGYWWRLLRPQPMRKSNYLLPVTTIILEKYVNLTRGLMQSETTVQRRLFSESAVDCSSESSGGRSEAPSDLKADAQNEVSSSSKVSNLKRLFSESAADCSSESSGGRTEAPSDLKADAQNEVSSSSKVSNLKTSSRHDLAMIFTCKVCETRQMKTCCRESYEKGVVVVRCGGCDNLHLIADRLGWFGEPGSIEDLLATRKVVVEKGALDSLNLTVEELSEK